MSEVAKWSGGQLLMAGGTDFENMTRKSKPKKGSAEEQTQLERAEKYPDLVSPTALHALLNVSVDFVAAGSVAQHFIVVDMDGVAYSMGRNTTGQLGLGDTTMRNMPVRIPNIEGRVVSAACGKMHTLLAIDSGDAFACGSNKYGQLGTGRCSADGKTEDNKLSLVKSSVHGVVTKVAAGAEFSMWLNDEGKLFAAGSGERGQLGDGSDHTFNSRSSSIKMEIEPQPTPSYVSVLAKHKVINMACGPNHSIALTDEVAVYTWGCGDYGRLGHGVQKDEMRPKLISGLKGHRSIPENALVACGGTSTLLSADTISYIWGKVKSSGDSIMAPQMSTDLQGWHVRSISAGPSTFAVAADTSTITWGTAQHGELGHGPKGKKSSAMPALAKPLDDLLTHQVACGNGFNLFLMDTSHEETGGAMEEFDIREAEEKDPFAVTEEGSGKTNKRAKAPKGKKAAPKRSRKSK